MIEHKILHYIFFAVSDDDLALPSREISGFPVLIIENEISIKKEKEITTY